MTTALGITWNDSKRPIRTKTLAALVLVPILIFSIGSIHSFSDAMNAASFSFVMGLRLNSVRKASYELCCRMCSIRCRICLSSGRVFRFA